MIAVLISVEPMVNAQTGDLEGVAVIRENLRSKRISSYDRSGGNNDRFENIAPGETATLAEISGAGMINHIWITIAPPPPELSRNDLMLRIYWDGNDYPSVEAPVGPFFGQGWDEAYNYASLPLAAGPVEGRALVSYFKMPFRTGAKIEVENQSDIRVQAFYYYIDYIETDEPRDDLGYFHAWYNHQLTGSAPKGENEWSILAPGSGNIPNKDGKDNYLILDTEGKGQYVGVNYYVNCPTPVWYGEGDDMFFIDGNDRPVLHGTGTEDYFNTSWCPREPYFHPYYGYPRVNGTIGWLGRTHVYRYHIEDPIYFEKSLKFSIEHGHANVLTLDLASVAYWYQDRPVRVKPVPGRLEREPLPEIGTIEIHRWRDEWRKSMGNSSWLWGDETLPPGNMVPQWYIIGPFSGVSERNVLQTSFSPEKIIDFKKTYPGGDRMVSWQQINTPRNGIIDFNAHFSKTSAVAAYAFTYVWAPENRKVNILAGSDDGIRIWLNGALIHDLDVKRGIAMDEDIVPANLKKGWNRLLVKVSDTGGGWGLCLRFEDKFGELKYGLTVE